MLIRTAHIQDIQQIQAVRNSVKENILSHPTIVSDKDVEEYITQRGKGWVCAIENQIVGFAIVDIKEHNVWALFVLPEFQGRGIGKKLHNILLEFYFTTTKDTLWLSTESNTRAELFYSQQGWQNAGVRDNGEVKLEMSSEIWRDL